MKSVFLATILSFLLPLSAFATSGACSYHGGVNCSYGSDYDGSVICNDGWRNSSVSFYSMNECDAYVSKCYYPSGVGCTNEQDYANKQKECDGIKILNSRYGIIDQTAENECINRLNQCRNDIDSYAVAVDSYNKCIQSESFPLIPTTKVTSVYDPIGCPVNSTYKDGTCDCGLMVYSKRNNTCGTLYEYCAIEYGEHSKFQSFSGEQPHLIVKCSCKDGYSLNEYGKCARTPIILQDVATNSPLTTPSLKPPTTTSLINKTVYKPTQKPIQTSPAIKEATSTPKDVTSKPVVKEQKEQKVSWFKRIFHSFIKLFE